MKILLVNKFFRLKGGSERVFFAEAELLKSRGHTLGYFSMQDERNVPTDFRGYFVDHVDYERAVPLNRKLKQSVNVLYSIHARKKMHQLLRDFRPDIVHLHNIHHQISPSILDVIGKYKIPTVMTLHDFKTVCPVYSLLSNGRLCRRCAGGRYFWCLLKRCNKHSYTKSLVNTAEMYLHNNILHMEKKIQVYISPSRFLQQTIREMGFGRKVRFLPNFITADDFTPRYGAKTRTVLYFGRISAEKGILTLMRAVKGLDLTLKIIGDGPLQPVLQAAMARDRSGNIELCGYMTGNELKREIRNAMCVVLPSECYENNPLAAIEAFALGKPVIGSRIGGIPELVRDDQTGLTFAPGQSRDLKEKIMYLVNNPRLIERMGRNARQYIKEELTPEKHYTGLMQVYYEAIRTIKEDT
ncbi:MAG: glycosyltransferase family 4 protein [Spirochaetia bacterium]